MEAASEESDVGNVGMGQRMPVSASLDEDGCEQPETTATNEEGAKEPGGTSVQTNLTGDEIEFVMSTAQKLLTDNDLLQKKLEEREPALPLAPFCEERMQKDQDVLFFTGLPNFSMLKTVFDFVLAGMPASSHLCKLTPFQEFIMSLMKLRLNSRLQELAYHFGVSSSTVSRVHQKWFTAMDIRLQHLIYWPTLEELQRTMPECFVLPFGEKVAVIIDCFEIFFDRPSNLMARAQT